MPKASTSAKYSTVARDYLGQEERGLGFVSRDPKGPDPTWFTAQPRVPKKPKGTDHLKLRSSRKHRMIARGWTTCSPFDPLGFRTFLMDGHGNVLAASPLAMTLADARWWLKRRLDQLLNDWDEGR